MEFYKLFYLIHRRTDWDELYEFEWRIMCPQEAKERDRRAHEALRKLNAINMAMSRIVDGIYCRMR